MKIKNNKKYKVRFPKAPKTLQTILFNRINIKIIFSVKALIL